MYPRGGVRTVSVANPTNGYAAEKGISKVVSDGEWKPFIYLIISLFVGFFKKNATCDWDLASNRVTSNKTDPQNGK